MYELVKSGGWLMLPIILCSIISISIIAERLWSLRRDRVIPKYLTASVWHSVKQGKLDKTNISDLSRRSALGKVLVAGLMVKNQPRERIKESIEDRGREVVHELERYLSTLGTIASISPLLGLLGTVIGMINVFSVITTKGIGDPGSLAGGISQAMITTAGGLTVAIVSLVFYRYFRRHVDSLVVEIEREAIKMVDVLHKNQSSNPS